jgi:hypothetical protein
MGGRDGEVFKYHKHFTATLSTSLAWVITPMPMPHNDCLL